MLRKLLPSKPVARAAIFWGAGVLLAAPAAGGLLEVKAAVLYAVAAAGCLAAGRFLAR